MNESKLDLLLHPVRLRLLQSLIGEELTARQLAARLPQVAQATLYRHLNRLVEAELIRVVEENRVRGTVEKVYALQEDAASLSPEEIAGASREDHLRYFTTFVITLLDDFARYLQRENIDFAADGAGYRQVALFLTDEELLEFTGQVNKLVEEALEKRPAPGRRRRLLSSILIPQEETEGPDHV
jgi:DNA-binding transcriptional ArsR family regulator